MSIFNIIWGKCGQMIIGNSDYDAEIEFNNHECIENGSSLPDLTEEELIQIIKGEKTEEEVKKEKAVKKTTIQ